MTPISPSINTNYSSYRVPFTIDEEYISPPSAPLNLKDVLMVLLEQIRKDQSSAVELVALLKQEKELHPEQATEFNEAIALLAANDPRKKLEALEIESDWVVVQKEKIVRESLWLKAAKKTGKMSWVALKVSGYVLYRLCFNDKVLKIIGTAGSVAAVVNLTSTTGLPVLFTVLKFLNIIT